MRKRCRVGVFRITLVALLGCSAPQSVDDDPGASLTQGRNVALYYHPDLVPCEGTVGYLDSNADAIAAYLNLPLVPPIPYHYRATLPDCTPDAVGCAIGSPGHLVTLWATTPDSVHELVHAVQLRQLLSTSFLMEGQAVSLGEPVNATGPAGLTDDQLLTPAPLPGDDYAVAGDFASYLLNRFGAAPFEQLTESVQWEAATDAVESAFTAVYGETMTELRSDRAASGEVFRDSRIALPECKAVAPDPRLQSGAMVSEALDCAAGAVGTQGRQMFRYVPFDVATDGLYAIGVTLPTQGAPLLTLTGCGSAMSVQWGQPAFFTTGAFVIGYMPAGRYAFELQADAAAAVDFGLTVQTLFSGSGASCPTATPVAIPQGTTALYVFSAQPVDVEFPIELSTSSKVVTGFYDVDDVEVCMSGCDAACVSTESVPAPSAMPASPFWLKVAAHAFAANRDYVLVNLE